MENNEEMNMSRSAKPTHIIDGSSEMWIFRIIILATLGVFAVRVPSLIAVAAGTLLTIAGLLFLGKARYSFKNFLFMFMFIGGLCALAAGLLGGVVALFTSLHDPRVPLWAYETWLGMLGFFTLTQDRIDEPALKGNHRHE